MRCQPQTMATSHNALELKVCRLLPAPGRSSPPLLPHTFLLASSRRFSPSLPLHKPLAPDPLLPFLTPFSSPGTSFTLQRRRSSPGFSSPLAPPRAVLAPARAPSALAAPGTRASLLIRGLLFCCLVLGVIKGTGGRPTGKGMFSFTPEKSVKSSLALHLRERAVPRARNTWRMFSHTFP